MRIRIGDLLVKAGVITDLQLKAALAEQSQWGGKLGDILVRMEFMNNAGNTMATVDPRKKRAEATGRTAPSAPPPVAQPRNGGGDVRPSAVEVLRGVEETQRRSVAALKAMVELLIEKGVFSRE